MALPLLLLLVPVGPAGAAIPQAERDALIALYNSTGGASWSTSTGWSGVPGTECTWYGVVCDGPETTVTQLSLAGNNLTGLLPTELGDLVGLQTVLLHSNALTSIPSSIGNLVQLGMLSLINNQLAGPIPSELGNLAAMQLLYLSGNQLAGAIPASLGNLPLLRILNLNQNQLSGAIPASLGNLASLETLDLSGNGLSGAIPASLGNLVNLQSLTLDTNGLSGSIPANLGNLANLTVLKLSSNQLSGSLPASLGNLTALTQLQLQYNRLSGTIPASIGNLTQVGHANLAHNQLTGAIPTSIGGLGNAFYLGLDHNQLTGAIPASLGSLATLDTLFLDHNKLTGALPAELAGLAAVTSLNLSSNQVSGTIPAWFASLANLVTLRLDHNQLTGAVPPGLATAPSLIVLALDSNRLTGSIPSELGAATGFYELGLSGNQLTGTIPTSLGNLVNLDSLRLGSNKLSGALPTELGNLTALRTLDLASNAFQGNIPTSLANCTALTSFDIRWNALSTTDAALLAFLDGKQPGWRDTQTVPPTNLAVYPATASSVALQWTPTPFSEGVGGNQVFFGSNPGGPYSLFGTTASKSLTSTTVTGLSPATTYYFALKATTAAHAKNATALVSDFGAEASGPTYTADPVQFSAATYKTSEAVASATTTVKRSGSLADAVSVDYQTSDGTAKAGVDYLARAGTLSFPAGVAVKSISIPILNDTLDENDETVVLRLSNPANAVLGPLATAVLTIADNDAGGALQFSASGYSVAENKGSATITVTRTGGVAGNVTVGYRSSSGGSAPATSGVDYDDVLSSLSFGPGQTTASFAVTIHDDGTAEGAETVLLELDPVTGGATLGPRSTAVLTILDDESTLALGAPTYTVAEGSTLNVPVKRSGSLAGTVTVDYATSDGSGVAGTDYTGKSGTLTFGANVSSRTISVSTIHDTLNEPNRTFGLALSNPSGTVIGGLASAVASIADNDLAGTVQFGSSGYSVAENGANATITVTRTGGTASGVTVDYTTGGGTATATTDYTATAGTLSFGANQASATFKVPVLEDATSENAETVGLTLLSAGGGGGLGPRTTATLTINDNDAPAFLFGAAAYSVTENGRTATISVRRVGSLSLPGTVTCNPGAGTATRNVDYSATSTLLSFGAGVASQTFAVSILDDLLDEPNETANFDLVGPSVGHRLGSPNRTVLTILDNDTAGALQLSSPSYSVVETDSGSSTQALVTVTRTGGTARAVTVDYLTEDGTATAGSDYVWTSNTLSFAASQASATFTVEVTGDAVTEGNEKLTLSLSSPQGGATLGAQSTATLWIVEPAAAAKLIFIHHSTGENWLADANGGLGLALRDNNYFVSDTNYGWGSSLTADPDMGGVVGDHTDIGNWWTWFRGSASAEYMVALYDEFNQNASYTRLADPDPTRKNEIVVFKSCFPNSNLGGLPTDLPTGDPNLLRGKDASSDEMTVANVKGIYNDLLVYFAAHPEKLFVVVTAPPLGVAETSPEAGANARAFNHWLVNDWLVDASYGQNNVVVFDFYNALTSNGGTSAVNDLGKEAGNHHRWWNGARQHVHPVANNYSAYATGAYDSHPKAAGGKKATGEFVALLNYFYNTWKGLPVTAGRPATRATKAPVRLGPEAIAPPGSHLPKATRGTQPTP